MEVPVRRIPAITLVPTVALMLVPLAGCAGTAVKQGLYAVMGAQGEFYELEVVDPMKLATYRAVRVEPFGNDLGERVPSEVVTEVNRQTPKTIAKASLFYPAGKTLRVTGRIIHYTGRSGLEGSVMSVIGGSEDCVCRVQLLDDQTGARVGEAVCWGVVKSAIRRGSEELGIGVGKGVAKWLRKRLPEVEIERRQAELKEMQEDEEDAGGKAEEGE
jgi:hypothetical protein